MPTLTQTQTVEPELELTEQQKAQLLQEFKLYESLEAERDDAERDLAVSKSVLDGLRVELGVKSVSPAPGYIVTAVDGGETSKLDLKRLCKAFKITPKTLAGYYTHKPKKGHTLITTPKATARAEAKKAAKPAGKAPRDERDVEDRDE